MVVRGILSRVEPNLQRVQPDNNNDDNNNNSLSRYKKIRRLSWWYDCKKKITKGHFFKAENTRTTHSCPDSLNSSKLRHSGFKDKSFEYLSYLFSPASWCVFYKPAWIQFISGWPDNVFPRNFGYGLSILWPCDIESTLMIRDKSGNFPLHVRGYRRDLTELFLE